VSSLALQYIYFSQSVQIKNNFLTKTTGLAFCSDWLALLNEQQKVVFIKILLNFLLKINIPWYS